MENPVSHSKATKRVKGDTEKGVMRWGGRKWKEPLVIWVTCSMDWEILKAAATYNFTVSSTSGRAKGQNMKTVSSNFNVASNSRVSKMAHMRTHTAFIAKSLSLF